MLLHCVVRVDGYTSGHICSHYEPFARSRYYDILVNKDELLQEDAILLPNGMICYDFDLDDESLEQCYNEDTKVYELYPNEVRWD